MVNVAGPEQSAAGFTFATTMRGRMMDIKVHCAYDELRNVITMVPHPKNPNKHPEKQLKLLAKIIEGHGWRAAITVSKRSAQHADQKPEITSYILIK